MGNIFEHIHAINNKIYSFNDTIEKKDYNQFIVNKGFSYFKDTVLYANEMNINPPRQDKQHYDFLFYGVSKDKRYSKWFKKDKDEDIELIVEYYGVSLAKASEILTLLNEDQIDEIKIRLEKGGVNARRPRAK